MSLYGKVAFASEEDPATGESIFSLTGKFELNWPCDKPIVMSASAAIKNLGGEKGFSADNVGAALAFDCEPKVGRLYTQDAG